MGYDGIVVTDAMEMGAISTKYKSDEAAVMSIQAGADMILMLEDFELAYNGVLEAVKSGEISEERLNESVARIIEIKLQMK
jgi:beta-N-acetylhexosaminidase